VIGRAVATSSGLGVVANGVRHEDLDAVIIGRWAMTRDLREHVARTRASGQLVVQDMDDLAWGGNDGEDRAWAKGGLALVDLVVCSTPYLADRARQAGARNVVVIRNMIDAERFAPVDQPETRPVFGWSGTVRTRERDVAVLRGVLGSFLEANACRFHHAGSHHGDAPPFARHAGLRPDLVTASGHEWPWRSELLYVDFHVGVIPLARSPWNLGKSALKGLEMAAAGIPAIASDTPEYRWAESEGLCVTARHPADWKRHLTRLLDRDERVAQADEARAAVKAHTPEARGDEWADALEEAMR
jgi:glycosyltransferase involved in cell wall biosynthesis